MARPGLDKHPKFRRLMYILSDTRAHCRGYLECLWETAYESGNPRIGDSMDVELASDWHGEQGLLTKALANCGGELAGFIEEIDGVWHIHDLYDHAPEYVQRRMEREAQRTAKGLTISQLRAEAGRKGGLAKAKQATASDKQIIANESKLPELAKQTVANGATPAPSTRTQHPAPEGESGVPDSLSAKADTSEPKALIRLQEVWNEIEGIQPFQRITSKRRTAFNVRAKTTGWLDSVRQALDKIRDSDFCHGHNVRQWMADIDWFLRPDTVVKILEGKYDNRNGNGEASNPQKTQSRLPSDDQIEEVRRCGSPDAFFNEHPELLGK